MAERFFRQERDNTCMVAALRGVLATQFEVIVPEATLRFAGDDAKAPIIRNGTDTQQLRRMVNTASKAMNPGPRWRLRTRAYGTLAHLAKEVREHRFPIVSVTVSDGAPHALIVCGYEPATEKLPPRVQIYDPSSGRKRWHESEAFRKMWRDSDGHTWMGVVL